MDRVTRSSLGQVFSSCRDGRQLSPTGEAAEATDPVALADGGLSLPFDGVADREVLLERLATLIDEAEEEVALSAPVAVFDHLESHLRAALERGVLVIVLVTDNDDLAASRFEGVASVARLWSKTAPLLATVDYRWGVMAPHGMLTGAGGDGALVLEQRDLAFLLMGSFFGNYWRIATQAYTSEPAPLPATYTNIRQAVFQATLHVQADDDVRVTAEAKPVGVDTYDTVEGRLADVRQSILEPVFESFAIENALILERETDDVEGERITLGGSGAFVEEFRTRSVTFAPLE
ncbi:TrmB family transcriptional regulator sugar-binding domain-containing protein [Natronobiforma cellulositropha]|uniref:TrmB family transcriptional regulator sugar-binding domain-containing protein n=1 Tax=Natronobiforma cellulositropha TaxID=1679076 RepID=UPI0021D5F03C|nr:TrmB family transcriptional regulator sugar-binding domain-containing protein [Natronobiforma cellulositropha]